MPRGRKEVVERRMDGERLEYFGPKRVSDSSLVNNCTGCTLHNSDGIIHTGP